MDKPDIDLNGVQITRAALHPDGAGLQPFKYVPDALVQRLEKDTGDAVAIRDLELIGHVAGTSGVRLD